MNIKQDFKLIRGAPNILNLSGSVINSYQKEENSPRHVFAILELKKKSIKHFTNYKIFDLISDLRARDSIQVVNFDTYPLPVSYNKPTNGMIVNLKPFEVLEIANMSPNDLYAAITYAYTFSKLVTGKFKLTDSYAKTIVNYLLSFYVQIFGKDYGLVGIYAQNIPKLKFLISCYVLASFFGYSTNDKLFRKATSISPYIYSEEYDQLRKYRFEEIDQFISALSDLRVMPGLSVQKYTSKLYRFFGINILPAMEDVSRFFCVMLTSSIPGSRVVPRYLFKYNEREYQTIIDITRRIF